MQQDVAVDVKIYAQKVVSDHLASSKDYREIARVSIYNVQQHPVLGIVVTAVMPTMPIVTYLNFTVEGSKAVPMSERSQRLL